MPTSEVKSIGQTLAPSRFVAFLGIGAVAVPAGIFSLGWREGFMVGFDVAAVVFLASYWPLIGLEAEGMRSAARRNDANRALLLGISASVVVAILFAVASELAQRGSPKLPAGGVIVATLVIAWVFSNTVYALHYAHIFYVDSTGDGTDDGGLAFPETKEPDYWDFIYFSYCLGMTFQTSDVDTTDGRMRRVVTGQSLLAFVFNLGVLAFTINVLGSG